MVVGIEIDIVVAVLGELVVGVYRDDLVGHRLVSRLDIHILRLGARAVVTGLEPFGKAELGVVRDHDRVGLDRGTELVGSGVHQLRVPLSHCIGTEKQLERLFVPNVQSSVVNAGRLAVILDIRLYKGEGCCGRIRGRLGGGYGNVPGRLVFGMSLILASRAEHACARRYQNHKKDYQQQENRNDYYSVPRPLSVGSFAPAAAVYLSLPVSVVIKII